MNINIPTYMNGLVGNSMVVSENVFGQKYNEPLIHQLINCYMANARSGTKAQKNRSDVSGGGAKPWKQKGSGRARAGSSRSPLWRTGGVTFAARTRDFGQKFNRKMYRAAMRSIYSELIRQDRLIVCDDIFPTEPKTKELLNKLRQYSGNKLLIITNEVKNELFLAARNLVNVNVCVTSSVSPVSLINSDKVIVTTEAIKTIEEKLG